MNRWGELRRRRTAQVAVLLAAAAGLALLANAWDADLAASQTMTLASVPVAEDPGLDPAAPVWGAANRLEVPLSGQLAAYPAGGGSVGSVTLQALNTPDTLYIRVEWPDGTRDGRLAMLTDFTDAVALEFPVQGTVSTPSICMGQPDAAVNIWQWRAVLERDGLLAEDEPGRSVYLDDDPWARIEPDEPDLAYPARYAGNPVSGVRGGPVLDLVAHAFGTLEPAASQLVSGAGVWQDGRWAVVFQRDLRVSTPDAAALGGGTTTDLAVAVWNGSEGDRNGQKSVSQFVKLSIPASMVVPGRTTAMDLLLTFVVPGLALVAAGAVVRWTMIGRR